MVQSSPFRIEPVLALAMPDDHGTTWVNAAKAGQYWHPKYEDFALTADDFRTMVKTFKAGIYPEPPTELPCDYDHRSLRASSPDDSKAAGWVKDLETRDDGQSLWARVAFTPPAVTALKNGEFRFLSGVFARAWRTFRGLTLGPTFVGLAITNTPTLQHLNPIALALARRPAAGASPHATVGALAERVAHLTREVAREGTRR